MLGIAWCCTTQRPVAKCQPMSVSDTVRNPAASAFASTSTSSTTSAIR